MVFRMTGQTTHENTNRRDGQFHVRGTLYLTAAFALWLFVLPDLRSEPIAVGILWVLASILGVCAHFMHTRWLPWRFTVVVGVMVSSVSIFAAVAFVAGALDGVVDILTIPFDTFLRQSWSDRIRSTIPCFFSTLALSAAHPIKPSLINAVITALGISIWYGLALLIAVNAG